MKLPNSLPKILGTVPLDWYLCTNAEEFHALQRREGISLGESENWILGDVAGAAVHYFDRMVLVCLEHGTPDDVIVHEAVHVAQGFFGVMKEQNPGEETMAYVVQFIYKTLRAELTARGEPDARG